MRLKSIKLAGFKSFVDPTTVPFPSNLCAVVGPNGCGKSNIIDAVRWVMGESSAKNLRGESMTDVIFNGSVNRKPVGQASIELIFDNSDGSLVGEYAAFTEISIRRKVTREGQSEYYLNGQKCRRRDITDIFLGTGLGPRSYAIIEQGMISRLIEAKPEELRVFIEEAAGISKYKERRRETENRMRRTQENLERLTDLRDELERQLQHLSRQAQAAERYTELKQEERQLRAQLQALQWRGLDGQASERERTIAELEVQLESVVAEQRNVDAAIERYRDSHIQLSDRFNEVQGRFYALGADIGRAEQSIQHQQERSRQLREDLAQTEESLRQALTHRQEDSEKLALWRAELDEVAPELELARARQEESAEALALAEEAMQGWQGRWDEFNQNAAEPRQQAEVQQSRIQHLEQVLRRIGERVARLEQEKSALVAGAVEEEIEGLSEQLAELELEREGRQQQVEGVLQALEERGERLRLDTAELDDVRGELQRMQGRRASLEALQQAALGRDDNAAAGWLEHQGIAGAARLGSRLAVRPGWETAVETVLGGSLQALCVDAIDDYARALPGLDGGSLTLVAGNAAAQTEAAAGSLAAQLLDPAAAGDLLQGIHAAEDLAAALALRPQLAAGESVVTRDGIWLGRDWLRVTRDQDASRGVLLRQQELEQLEQDIAMAAQRLEALQQRVEEGREQRQQLERQRETLRREAEELGRRNGELRAELSARQVRVEQITARRAALNREIDDSREQSGAEQEHLGEARLLLAEAIERMEADVQAREALLAERDSSRSALDQARQRSRHDRDAVHQLAMREQSLRTQLDSMQQNMSRAEAQVAQLEQRRDGLSGTLAEGESPVEALRMELEALLEQRLAVEEELGAARRELDAVEHELRRSEQSRHGIEQRLQELRLRLEGLRVETQGLIVRRRTLQEQLQESQFDLDTVLGTLPEAATEAEWQEQLEQVGRRIARLGPINLAAIDEYKMQSERKHYLDAQNDDLVEALTTLENAIRRIDKETRNRFKETFDQVNQGLGELFPRVFGGGHAYLEMTGDDLLDTGIAIMARPPGKRNSTIHLLSGGEKALTAIALVFSIFRLNPAPFCMLDEVDAPLDDANVGRYARMVKEMSSQVQFIYITHNKIAMEMADQLMGVTMHEPGVSRLVSVDVEEAAEMAAL